MEKFGIENLTKVLQFGIHLGLDTQTFIKNGAQISEALTTLVPDLLQLTDFIKNKQAIIDEAKDLSIAEIEQLIEVVKDSALITSDKVKDIIEKAVTIISSVMAIIEDLKPAS